MTRKVLVAIAAVVLVSNPALADLDSLGDRILACAEEANETQRLACYDREAGRLSDAGEKVSAEIEAAPAVVTEPAVVAERALPSASASAAVDEFGVTPELADSKPEVEKDTELREISATVVKVSERPRGELVVTLDNGQTWTEKYAEFGFRVKVGDTIIIKKGKFSGVYRMVGRGRRSSQVRRIN
jgi:hypothetical protein